MKKRPLFHRRASLGSPRNRPGFALVVALAAVVLMTVLVLAFFSRAILNRKVAFSSANQTKAEMMARYALDIVAGQVRQEIVDYSNEANGVFNPIASTNMLPLQVGVAGADTNAGKYLIAKVAADGLPVNPGSSGFNLGSSVSVDVPSRNGRSEARWFTSGPNLGSATLPTWVYLSRGSGIATNLTASAGADPANPDYVIGRFTYTVYNTGGLLNANVAGYPTIASTNARTKSSLAYADLSVLGIDANVLAKWRNAGTATNAAIFDEWATGIPGGTNGASLSASALKAARSGHLSATPGDNVFYSRRDLLRYLETSGAATNSAQSLTHSSLASDAPSWRPSNVTGANINYGDEADQEASINRSLPGVTAYAGTMRIYADDGTSEEIDVTENDPLVPTRFSLAKLAWLGHNGPNVAAFHPSLTPAQRERAILDCFGLTWFNVSGGSSSDARWEYNHGNPNDIMILSEVQDEDRAPDFFELLKAGILSGSLGGQPGTATTAILNRFDIATAEGPIGEYFEDFSADDDRHILQIGANIIDQADANNYPTAIHMDLTPRFSGTEREFHNTVFGLENLPLLQRIAMISAMPKNSADGTLAPLDNWLQPELWNPHEKSSAGAAIYPETPVSLRMAVYGTVRVQHVNVNPLTNYGDIVNFGTDYRNPGSDGTVNFRNPSPDATKPVNFFDSPRLVTIGPGDPDKYSDPDFPIPAGSKNRYPSDPDKALEGNNDFLGVHIGQVLHDPAEGPGKTLEVSVEIPLGSELTFVLEYFDGASWRPYNSISRVRALRSNTGTKPHGSTEPQSLNGHPDPRTQRFSAIADRPGAGGNRGWKQQNTMRSDEKTTLSTTQASGGRAAILGTRPRTASGFVYSPYLHGASTYYYLLDSWAENVTANARGNNANNNYYRDPDGIVRPGDSWRADYSTGDGVPLFHYDKQTTSRDRRRPVILNRPFRSAGELSYAFRDQPFKTLDFWSEKSADAGLLDLFTVSASDGGRTTAQVNLNAATPAVLTALLSGAGKQATTNQTLDLSTSERVATAMKSVGPQTIRSSLGDGLAEVMFSALTTNSTGIEFRNKSYGEAPVRALAEISTTRTWNLLIDVVAQSGRLAVNAGGLHDFMVEGECRYWMHLAIDRLTGKILDQQLEPVYD